MIRVLDSPKRPPQWVTMTPRALAKARVVHLLVSGAEKLEALTRAVRAETSGSRNVIAVPTLALHPQGRTVIWWMNTDAAGARSEGYEVTWD